MQPLRLREAGTIRHKLDVLKRHCEDVGRNYEEIERTVLGTVNLGPESMMPNVHDISPFETFEREIISAVAAL